MPIREARVLVVGYLTPRHVLLIAGRPIGAEPLARAALTRARPALVRFGENESNSAFHWFFNLSSRLFT